MTILPVALVRRLSSLWPKSNPKAKPVVIRIFNLPPELVVTLQRRADGSLITDIAESIGKPGPVARAMVERYGLNRNKPKDER